MACNKETCPNFTPTGDGSGTVCANPCGVQCTRKISPVWDTSRINVPKWHRDKIMYYYDDVCEQSALHTSDGTGGTDPNSTQVNYGTGGVENPNAGKVRKVLPSGFWWQGDNVLCPPTFSRGTYGTAGVVSKVRYWDHYPSEQSFEPISSDTWFSYLYDTSTGVTGQPCHVYCYYMYTLSSSGGGKATNYQTYYGIKKVPYNCNCDPIQSYVSYALEDGKITPEEEIDQYPLVWSVGTAQQRIAFTYSGSQLQSTNINFKSYLGYRLTLTVAGQSIARDYGTYTTVFNTSTGSTNTEVFNYLGGVYDMYNQNVFYLKSYDQIDAYRYTTDMLVVPINYGSNYFPQKPEVSPVAYINATWRPSIRDDIPNLNGGARLFSKIKFNSYRLASGESSVEPNTEYDVWVRRENKDHRAKGVPYLRIGRIKFSPTSGSSFTTSSTKKSIPVTFHIGEPKQYTASTGTDLSTMGLYEIWNAGRTASYMSSQGKYWKSRNTRIIQDYSIPNGTIIRCEISSYYDTVASKYYTRWKILRVIRYGSDYTAGDGSTYSNQNIYYLYYPNATDPDRVGVALMISGTNDGDWSQGSSKIAVGDTINGWTVSNVKHTDEDFNMHVAYLEEGSNIFTKDTSYTSSNGITITVKAGFGIKDRAALIGRYEFQRKEIQYVTAEANLDVPQEDLDVIKPQLQAVVENGKVTAVQVLKPGKNLKDPLIEPIKIAIQPPPGSLNNSLYLQLLKDGVEPSIAYDKAKGTGKQAFCEPIFSSDVLVGVKILNGGSGYSTTKPPIVSVPYIARNFVTIDVPKTNTKATEDGAMQLFDKSEAFKKMSNTPYIDSKYELNENPILNQTAITDATGDFTGKYKFDITKAKKTSTPKSGFDKNEYIKKQDAVYGEKTTTHLKGPIKQLTRQKNSQIYVRPKSGMSKESAQAFLPPGNKNHVSTKNNDYKNLLSSIDKQTKTNVAYFKSFSTAQQTLIATGKLDPTISQKINDGLSSEQKIQLNGLSSVVSANLKTPSSEPIRPTDSYSSRTLSQIETIEVSVKNVSDGQYYDKAFRNFYRQNSTIPPRNLRELDSTLNNIDKIYEDNINSIWEMDLDENRTLVYDGAAVKVVKYGFFNLPCATNATKYMVQSYCPDPRKNTFMNITVGVKVGGKNEDDLRGPCTECLYQDSAVLSAYNTLKNQYGSSVDIADAFCQVYAFPSYYGGQSDGVNRGIPFSAYTLPYASTLFGGYSRTYMKTFFAEQRVVEGCRDYEFSGNLEILHDRTLETETFVEAINRYGNPYDALCSRQYEEPVSYDEMAINNTLSAYSDFLSDAVAQLSDPISYSE
jgi:hypothetical protein